MTILFIPVASLSKSKSRLSDCLTQIQRQEFTIALFKDFAEKIENLDIFQEKVIYSPDNKILELAETYNLKGIQEIPRHNSKNFNTVISEMDKRAIDQFEAKSSLTVFLDLPLLTRENLVDLHNMLKNNQLVVSPALNSAGISALGRQPVDVMFPQFDDPNEPSLLALYKTAIRKGIKPVLYDSLRASFDVDIKHDLYLAFEYLKIFDLTESHTYNFLENNLDQQICKKEGFDNRDFIYRQKEMKN
ncbi:MAG: hypothetical protein ACOC44_14990 [Promethearchaeia archaeon]